MICRTRLAALAAALMLIAAACGGSADRGSASTYTSESGGFSLVIPDSFRVIDTEVDDLPALLADTELTENAQLVIANTLSGPASGFLLWAFDFDAGNEAFIPNLNIVRQPRLPNDRVDFLRDRIEIDYSGGAGADVLSVEEFEAPTGESLVIEALFPINGVDDDSHAFQLITFTDEFSFTITYNWINPTDDQRELAVESFATFQVDQ